MTGIIRFRYVSKLIACPDLMPELTPNQLAKEYLTIKDYAFLISKWVKHTKFTVFKVMINQY